MGGRATISGTSFQAEVGACLAGLLLTERPLSRLDGKLPSIAQQLQFEVPPGGMDDIVVITDVGRIFIQAKSSISLSRLAHSELASMAAQFVRKYQAGVVEHGVRRDFSPARDRLVLAVSTRASNTVANDLREVLDSNRTGAATGLLGDLQHALDNPLPARQLCHGAGAARAAQPVYEAPDEAQDRRYG